MSQTCSNLEGISNLSTVPFSRSIDVFSEMLSSKFENFRFEDEEVIFTGRFCALFFDFFQAGEVDAEDFFGLGFA